LHNRGRVLSDMSDSCENDTKRFSRLFFFSSSPPSKECSPHCAPRSRALWRARSVIARMDAREMAPDEVRRSRQGSPGREDDEGMGDDPRVDPDDRRYDSTHEAEYDPEDDRNVDDVDVDEAYDDDGYSKEEPDEEEDEPGGGFLGLMSYLWMLVALALFAYLIHKVQQQASVIKALQQRAASMEARLGLAPMKPSERDAGL